MRPSTTRLWGNTCWKPSRTTWDWSPTILCSALEMQQQKSAPGLNKYLNPLNWQTRREVRNRTDFRIDNDRINVACVGVGGR